MGKSLKPVPITVARGDGIGPEIMDATLKILDAAGAALAPEFVDLGLKAYEAGIPTGVSDQAWGSIHCTNVVLKAPLTTPQGGGFKSVNVTLRKSFGLYANVRPTRTFTPYVPSRFKDIDLVVVRENEEDLYAGMEYSYSPNAATALKLVTRQGAEKIIRYAFEYARCYGRKKVSCMVKDNIMKICDGMFHEVFDLVGEEYPEIEQDVHIVDIGMARVADTPEDFDVVVTLNLYGDIVSDIASQVAGSVGLAGSMNIGTNCAMFEAVHGSAPDIAGQGIANPSGLLNGAVLMLHHIGQNDIAAKIENAWLTTLEQGQVTSDIAKNRRSNDKQLKPLSTSEFADAVIGNLGAEPEKFPKVDGTAFKPMDLSKITTTPKEGERALVGADVFMTWDGAVDKLGEKLLDCAPAGMELKLVSSRGTKVWPGDFELPISGDLFCGRFMASQGALSNEIVRNLLANIQQAGLEWAKVENLYVFDEVRGYSLLQGE